MLESGVDGRAVFAIPWSGYTWIGTTDTDFDGDPADAVATPEDVKYMVDSIATHLPAVREAKKVLDDGRRPRPGARGRLRVRSQPDAPDRARYTRPDFGDRRQADGV